MACIDLVKTDLQKEDKGVWIDFELGIRLKIARARNSAYREVMRELTEPHLKDIREGEMPLDKLEDLLKQVRAKTILLDWENIEDKDGDSIPYSPEQALVFFNDPELRDFYTFVVLASENMENFKKKLIKDAEKNLQGSSNGNSTGDNTKIN